ncbi:hypothetical protein CFIO01_08331 [Colletotrichum fioriniae PJ7]|uniref:Uncharacterized protein n=1 Tax=Colletotrichum fioriniae PJ7 TaxID=1445577 RepID=A0A010R6I5_9PEZI|nr:hypothetical protein CFIO01_08331 [Colletotrichum fioriniae PJ7]
MPFSFTSSISFSSSISHNGKTEEKRWARKTERSPSGTTVRTASYKTGEPVYLERREYDSAGRALPEGRAVKSDGTEKIDRRIEDVSERE